MKALIGMSGGVDSSVAALLMQQAGFECIGATMRLYAGQVEAPNGAKTCCSLDDVEDARSVARRMGIPHYVFNFTEEFYADVIDKFVDTYYSGGTPNPCIDCNRYLKFGKLLQRARELGCGCVVSGHYAKVERDGKTGRFLLKRAADRAKDQTYFLACLTQEQLSMVRFPLGELTKEQVRRIAGEHGFVTARKHDSQDICFVPGGDYTAFLEEYTGKKPTPGDYLDQNGCPVGRHRGAVCYTIGQRKGLGIGGRRESLFILATDTVQNVIWVGEGDAHPGLWRPALHIVPGEIHWVNPARELTAGQSARFSVRIRYRLAGRAAVRPRRRGLPRFRPAPAGHHPRTVRGVVRRRPAGRIGRDRRLTNSNQP